MLRKLQNFDLQGKKVLVRVDFNVPMNPDGTISDATRLRESLPTIFYILDHGGSIILMSHLGRPKGKDPKFTLKPCAKALADLLHHPVLFFPDCIGKEVKTKVDNLKKGEIFLLENLRFYPAEEEPEKDPSFAKSLSELGDIYIDDAFGAAHRSHSSIVAITKYFPNTKGTGLLLQKEIAAFEQILKNPKRPFYALIGGAKVSSKLGVLQALLTKTDAIFIGGGMAFTFLKAQGIPIGNSLCEDNLIPQAQEFIQEAQNKKIPIYFPQDTIIANRFDAEAQIKIISIPRSVETFGIPDGWQGMDIGPETCRVWLHHLQNAKTIFWNGPFGVFEIPPLLKGPLPSRKAF